MTPDELASLIRNRRSSLLIDATSVVSREDIESFADAAQWAPNHKRTWPLRLCAVSGDSRRELGEVIATAMQLHGDDVAKVEKTRIKYMRAPLVLIAASAVGTSESETTENSYAVAAGIQNLLLMAEARGYATLWGSPAKGSNRAITDWCGMNDTDTVLGLIYVGRPTKQAPEVSRPPANLTYRN